MRVAIAAALVMVSFAANADPGPGLTGNDTGGIIQWTPVTAHYYREIAADHCARWHRIARITSVHPWYGDYVGFVCLYDRHYDPRKSLLDP
jgi:hypothetical protein